MPTYPTLKMRVSSIDDTKIPSEDIEYHVKRLQNRVFNVIVDAFAQEINAGRINRTALAKKIDKGPDQISRWLSQPSNYRLDTIARLLIGMDAELDPVVTFIRDKSPRNYAHSLIDYIDSAVTAAPRQSPPQERLPLPKTNQKNHARARVLEFTE